MIWGLAMAIPAAAYLNFYTQGKTGKASLDARVRGALAFHLIRVFGLDARVEHMRALMAIANNEGAHLPKPIIGDKGASGGPSVGPMQVYRRTAQDMGLWVPPPGASGQTVKDAYAMMAHEEWTVIGWGVEVFRDKLRQAKGNLREAIRRYNGSGPMAEAYAERAVAFYRQTWGAFP